MSEVSLAPVSAGDLSVTMKHEGDTITVFCIGTADMRAGDALDGILTKVHEIALTHAVARVDIDFRALEFMNSACFKSFVTWISNVRELEPQKKYAIHFWSKPELLWQRRSLHALRCFATDVITIEG